MGLFQDGGTEARVVLDLIERDQEHLLWLAGESEVSHDKSDGFYALLNF
jgi:hypothetical protein